MRSKSLLPERYILQLKVIKTLGMQKEARGSGKPTDQRDGADDRLPAFPWRGLRQSPVLLRVGGRV